MFVKKYDVSYTVSSPITPIIIFSGNEEYCRENFPDLMTESVLDKADARFGTARENLCVIPLINNKPRVMNIHFDGITYELRQTKAILLDGASTPINIGDIDNYGTHCINAFYAHDLLYGLFIKSVGRKTADKIYTAILELDGADKAARAIQFTALRMFGNRATKMSPEDHWNYGRVSLSIYKK